MKETQTCSFGFPSHSTSLSSTAVRCFVLISNTRARDTTEIVVVVPLDLQLSSVRLQTSSYGHRRHQHCRTRQYTTILNTQERPLSHVPKPTDRRRRRFHEIPRTLSRRAVATKSEQVLPCRDYFLLKNRFLLCARKKTKEREIHSDFVTDCAVCLPRLISRLNPVNFSMLSQLVGFFRKKKSYTCDCARKLGHFSVINKFFF